jgi:hypothetical protein
MRHYWNQPTRPLDDCGTQLTLVRVVPPGRPAATADFSFLSLAEADHTPPCEPARVVEYFGDQTCFWLRTSPDRSDRSPGRMINTLARPPLRLVIPGS